MAAELTLEQFCRSYTNIHTVSCMVRKTTELQGHTAKMLSRVYYQRPDRLHVENIVPLRRRIPLRRHTLLPDAGWLAQGLFRASP